MIFKYMYLGSLKDCLCNPSLSLSHLPTPPPPFLSSSSLPLSPYLPPSLPPSFPPPPSLLLFEFLGCAGIGGGVGCCVGCV